MSNASSKGFAELVDAIIESYRSELRTCHVDVCRLPSQEVIVEIIGLLRQLLFPGYFGRQNLASETLAYHVGHLLSGIHDRLLKQVQLALAHQVTRPAEGVDDTPPPVEADAPRIVEGFLSTIPRLRAILATDAQAAFDGDPAATSIDEVIFSYPGFYAITVHRLAHELQKSRVPLIPRIMTEYAHSVTGIDIHPGATIDEYFFIDHGTGVVIGETSDIGKRVKLYQGVTIGALSTRGGQTLRGVKRHPTLEDDVTVYSGASVLGGDTVVGEGAVISGHVFITQSVPAHTRVTMKSPELTYKDKKPREFKQEFMLDFVI